MLGNKQRLLIMTLIGTNLANVLAALTFKALIQRGFVDANATAIGMVRWSELLSLLLLTPALIIFAEILPKAIFRAHAETFVRRMRPVYVACLWLFHPAIRAVEILAHVMLGPFTDESSRAMRRLTRQDVINLVKPEDRTETAAPSATEATDAPGGTPSAASRPAREAARAAVAPEVKAKVERAFEQNDERRMVENILTLHLTTAEEIMTPLVDLVAVQLGRVDLDALRALAISSGYSRFPVYRDRIVHLIGFIDIYRVLREYDGTQSMQDFVERPHYVPETKRVDDLLQEFLERRIKNAIVVDEYGGCSGWISREDIIEEIVGELEDELDEPTTLVLEKEPGCFEVDGRTEIDELNDRLGADFDDDNWETAAGLVLAETGRIPEKGDQITIDGWRVTVLEMDRQRIARLEFRRGE